MGWVVRLLLTEFCDSSDTIGVDLVPSTPTTTVTFPVTNSSVNCKEILCTVWPDSTSRLGIDEICVDDTVSFPSNSILVDWSECSCQVNNTCCVTIDTEYKMIVR